MAGRDLFLKKGEKEPLLRGSVILSVALPKTGGFLVVSSFDGLHLYYDRNVLWSFHENLPHVSIADGRHVVACNSRLFWNG